MKINRQFSRGFLIAASAYRRHARGSRMDFSAEALRAQYEHETRGAPKPDASANGYTFGKLSLDVTLAAMREDHASGLFTKQELCSGSCTFVRRAVRRFAAAPFFGYVHAGP